MGGSRGQSCALVEPMTAEAELFRSIYGRLCTLTALALHDGYHTQAVYLAHIAQNTAQDPQLQAVNRAATNLDTAIRTAHAAGLSTTVDLVPIATDIKATVESEWNLEIPIVPPSPIPSG